MILSGSAGQGKGSGIWVVPSGTRLTARCRARTGRVAASGGGFGGIGGPGGGLGHLVGRLEEAVDGDLQLVDGAEDAALQSSFGEFGEEALDGVQPGAGGRHEVEGEALVPVEPAADF